MHTQTSTPAASVSILNDRLFSDIPLTPEEEAMLDRLEQEYMIRIRAQSFEDYDYFSIQN
jgi:hypothetical protein